MTVCGRGFPRDEGDSASVAPVDGSRVARPALWQPNSTMRSRTDERSRNATVRALTACQRPARSVYQTPTASSCWSSDTIS